MKFQNEKQILNIIKYTPPLFILLILFMILSILFIENRQTFNTEKAKIETAYIKENKELIKNQVSSAYEFIKSFFCKVFKFFEALNFTNPRNRIIRALILYANLIG